MSRKETAESRQVLTLIGKPTPETRYNRKNNPAIAKLLAHYSNDVTQVFRWYDVLKKLGWVNTGL